MCWDFQIPMRMTNKPFLYPPPPPPPKAVVKKGAESTQLRIVYDASARENNSAPSLNGCLHPGPALQNQL